MPADLLCYREGCRNPANPHACDDHREQYEREVARGDEQAAEHLRRKGWTVTAPATEQS
jgi:hypothetical protein